MSRKKSEQDILREAVRRAVNHQLDKVMDYSEAAQKLLKLTPDEARDEVSRLIRELASEFMPSPLFSPHTWCKRLGYKEIVDSDKWRVRTIPEAKQLLTREEFELEFVATGTVR